MVLKKMEEGKPRNNQTYFYRVETKVRRRAPPDSFPSKIGECKLNKYKHLYIVAQKSVFAMA
jgi:hypothetical protein